MQDLTHTANRAFLPAGLAIRYVIQHRTEMDVAEYWKVDRVSRGVLPYYTLKGVLARHDVRIEFATE